MTDQPTITLYQFETCPFCLRVRSKLYSLGIKYEKVEVDRNNKPAIVTETGGMVPVVKIGEKVMSDSARIIEYLEENF